MTVLANPFTQGPEAVAGKKDMYSLLRPLLFSLPPEAAHATALAALRVANRLRLLPSLASPSVTPVTVMGLKFPNRIGLAAGFDKNGVAIDACAALGFGFVEVGTVTPLPQIGNPKPRLFRLRRERVLINRMGFPNAGVAALCARLRNRSSSIACGVNIGKNAGTPLERAVDDYVRCLAAVHDLADYVAINISSPNTAQLRGLQQGGRLRELLNALLESRASMQSARRPVPLLVKLAADLSDEELREAARVARSCGIDGIVATNTTVQRTGLRSKHAAQAGGLSGPPLLQRAAHALQCIRAEVGANMCLIGVGGIQSAQDAQTLRAAGADLLQLYTGLVYRGPGLLRNASRID
jgi:dihydroorotate dehydrogenase